MATHTHPHTDIIKHHHHHGICIGISWFLTVAHYWHSNFFVICKPVALHFNSMHLPYAVAFGRALCLNSVEMQRNSAYACPARNDTTREKISKKKKWLCDGVPWHSFQSESYEGGRTRLLQYYTVYRVCRCCWCMYIVHVRRSAEIGENKTQREQKKNLMGSGAIFIHPELFVVLIKILVGRNIEM